MITGSDSQSLSSVIITHKASSNGRSASEFLNVDFSFLKGQKLHRITMYLVQALQDLCYKNPSVVDKNVRSDFKI